MNEPAVPPLALAIAYWLHMLATVLWIGGLSAISLLVLPVAGKVLEPSAMASLLDKLQARLQQVGWFCLAVLIATGMFQMSSSPFYKGFLAIDNPWAMAILAKHLVIGVMIVASAYVTWGLLPALQRTVLLRAAGRTVDEAKISALHNQETWLLRLNLGLSVIVLLLTALARAVK